MNPRTVRRAAAAALLTAISCNVYDSSLLVGGAGSSSGGSGTTAGSGGVATAGTENGDDAGAGNVGVAGTQPNGGSTTGGSENLGGEPAQLGGQGGGGGDDGGAGETNGGSGGSSAGTTSGGVSGGGSGGMAGRGGTAGSGGSAGTGGGGAGGSGGVESATGCAKLGVPLTAVSDQGHFVVSLPNTVDMSPSTVTVSMRLYVQTEKGGVIHLYAQDSSFRFMASAAVPQLTSFTGWSTLTWAIGMEPQGSSNIVRSQVNRIGIEITGAGATSWSNPTVVYVDSISVNTAAPVSFTFDTIGTVTTSGTGSGPMNTIWWNNATSDTTSGKTLTLAWQATCP